MDFMEELYKSNNLAVMLATRFAQMLNLEIGIGEDPLELGWPVLYITLPDGEQVSWRMPPEHLIGEWPEYRGHHDGHTPAERSARLSEYLRQQGFRVKHIAAASASQETQEMPSAPALKPASSAAAGK